MSNTRWQYQQWAEVPPAQGSDNWKEDTHPDKYAPVYPPLRRALPIALATAIAAGSFFYVPPPYGNASVCQPEVVDRHLARPTRQQPTDAAFVYYEEPPPPAAPGPDSWGPTTPDVPYPRKFLIPAIQSGSSFLGDIPRSETIFITDWEPTYPDAIRTKPAVSRALEAGHLFFTDYRRPLGVSDWEPTYPDAVAGRPAMSRALREGHLSYTERAPSRVDGWQPEIPDQLKRAPGRLQPVPAPFLYTPPPSETITPDKWLGFEPDLIFIRRGLSRAIAAGSEFRGDIPRSETIFLSEWTPRLPDIQFRRAYLIRAITSGSLFWSGHTPPSGEILTLDKWQPIYPERVLRVPPLSRAIRSGSFFLGDIPRKETVFITEWLPRLPDVYFPKSRFTRSMLVGVDITFPLSAYKLVSDSGSGSEVIGIAASLALSDSGLGLDDLPGSQVAFLITDSGSMSQEEVAQLLAYLLVEDSGSGAELITVEELQESRLYVVDFGLGTEAITVVKRISAYMRSYATLCPNRKCRLVFQPDTRLYPHSKDQCPRCGTIFAKAAAKKIDEEEQEWLRHEE